MAKKIGYINLSTGQAARSALADGEITVAIKCVFDADAAPTTGDDVQSGYQPGSRWVTSDGAVYICADASEGAAVWRRIPKNNFSAAAAPGATDDADSGYSVGSKWIITTAGNLTDGDIYICSDATAGAAVWQLVHDAA